MRIPHAMITVLKVGKDIATVQTRELVEESQMHTALKNTKKNAPKMFVQQKLMVIGGLGDLLVLVVRIATKVFVNE